VKAFSLVSQQKFGEMTAIKGDRISSSPLSEAAKGTKPVSRDVYKVAQRFFG